ncbi:MAG: putative hydrocarbon binding protein [Paraglaciecola sp.]|jgi:predicted hydrocarbon binding protein
MKGIVFVKLGEFVEETWGLTLWDELLQEANLGSGGIYTSVGLFDDQEFFSLIALIVNKKAMTAEEVQKKFGKWMFKELYAAAPPRAHDFVDVFEFLHGVQNIIHVEVKKLYPDVLLPEFDFLFESEKILRFHYKSPRKLCHFCEGLVYGLSEHVNQDVTVSHVECEHHNDDRCVLEVTKVG